MNNKNVIYPLGKKEKVVIQLYHEEIQFFVLFKMYGPWFQQNYINQSFEQKD